MRAASGCLEIRKVYLHEETLLGSSDTSLKHSTFSIHQTGDTHRGRSSIIRERERERERERGRERETEERTGINTYSYSWVAEGQIVPEE